jgi:CRISPR-associated endoribonuclease Cas6
MEPAVPLPQHKSSALQTVVIHLGAADSRTLSSTCGRAIHAQVLDWFRQGDPKVSEAIHKSQESPLSLSGLMGQSAGHKCKRGTNLVSGLGY